MDMKDGFSDWRETSKKISMSEKAGRMKQFKKLVETACVHIDERELIAWCMAYGRICPEDKEFRKFLKKIAIPVLTEVGRARWYRSEVTDLGLALSMRKKSKQDQDTSKMLDEDEDA